MRIRKKGAKPEPLVSLCCFGSSYRDTLIHTISHIFPSVCSIIWTEMRKKWSFIFFPKCHYNLSLEKTLRIKIKYKIKTYNNLIWIITEKEKWERALQVKYWPPTEVCKCTFSMYLTHISRTQEFFSNRNPHCHLPTVPFCYKMYMHTLLSRLPMNNLCQASWDSTYNI